jgi:hypothetical protein
MNGWSEIVIFSRKSILIIYRKGKFPENDQAMRKSPRHVPWVRALSLYMCKEDPCKLYKIKIATTLIKWFLNGRLVNVIFPLNLNKNDRAMRKSPGHVPRVRALGLFMCKEDPLKLYKIKIAMELIKWLFNGWLVKMIFFPKFI